MALQKTSTLCCSVRGRTIAATEQLSGRSAIIQLCHTHAHTNTPTPQGKRHHTHRINKTTHTHTQNHHQYTRHCTTKCGIKSQKKTTEERNKKNKRDTTNQVTKHDSHVDYGLPDICLHQTKNSHWKPTWEPTCSFNTPIGLEELKCC